MVDIGWVVPIIAGTVGFAIIAGLEWIRRHRRKK